MTRYGINELQQRHCARAFSFCTRTASTKSGVLSATSSPTVCGAIGVESWRPRCGPMDAIDMNPCSSDRNVGDVVDLVGQVRYPTLKIKDCCAGLLCRGTCIGEIFTPRRGPFLRPTPSCIWTRLSCGCQVTYPARSR